MSPDVVADPPARDDAVEAQRSRAESAGVSAVLTTEAVAAQATAGTAAIVVVPKRTATEIAVIVLAVLATIAAMRVAQPFLVPVIVGILLSYTLRPLVSMLERWHVPRAAASGIVIAVLISLVSASIYVLREDMNNAVAELPSAARKLRYAATESARKAPGPLANVKEAAAELDKAAAEASGKPASATPPPPPAVAVEFQTFVAKQSEQAFSVLAQTFTRDSACVVSVGRRRYVPAQGRETRRCVARPPSRDR